MRFLSKTQRQKEEYNLLKKKKDFIINWRLRNAGELKTANKHYYLGNTTKEDTSILQLSHHYNIKLNRIIKLMKHVPQVV